MLKDIGPTALPDAESEESSNDEQIIKDCQSNQQPVESFSELFPLHDDDSDSISLKHNHISVILDQQDSYLKVRERQQKWNKHLQPRKKNSEKRK